MTEHGKIPPKWLLGFAAAFTATCSAGFAAFCRAGNHSRLFQVCLWFLLVGLPLPLTAAASQAPVGELYQAVAAYRQAPSDWNAICAVSRLRGIPVTKVPAYVTVVQLEELGDRILDDERQTMALAKSYIALEQYAQAKKLLASFPGATDNPHILRELAWATFLSKDYDRALSRYALLSAKFPYDLGGAHGQMMTLMEMEQYPAAFRIGEMILQTDPQHRLTLLRMGSALYHDNQFQMALTYFTLHPDDPDFVLGAALSYWKLGDFRRSGELLRKVEVVAAREPKLQKALFQVNKDAIVHFSSEARLAATPQQRLTALHILGRLYEENRDYLRAAQMMEEALTFDRPPAALENVGRLYRQAGKFSRAAGFYLEAGKMSPTPHVPILAAVDAFLLGNEVVQAEKWLNYLERMQPGTHLNEFWARLYGLKGETSRAQKIWRQLGDFYERQAIQGYEPRANYLRAADCYIDGALWDKANEVLGPLAAETHAFDIELDERYARMHVRRKEYAAAATLQRKYPDSLTMQVEEGMTHLHLQENTSADAHFRNLDQRFPHQPMVEELQQTAQRLAQPCNLGYAFTALDFGDSGVAGRNVHSVSFGWTHNRMTWAIADSITDSAGFGEHLAGGKFVWRLNDRAQTTVYGMYRNNDDPATDNGTIVGGCLEVFPAQRWHADLALSGAFYDGWRSVQTSGNFIWRMGPRWRSNIGIVAASITGNQAWRAESNSPIAGRTAVTFQDHELTITLAGTWGTMILPVDPDNWRAIELFDTYRQGVSLSVRRRASDHLQLFCLAGFALARSEAIRTANVINNTNNSPDYTAGIMMAGLNLTFP